MLNAGLAPELLTRLTQVLLRCGPFASDRELRAAFVDARIAAWRDRLPEASSRQERVQALVNTLFDQADAQGNSVLLLFVCVLRDHVHAGDACERELQALADALAAPPESGGSAATPTPSAHTTFDQRDQQVQTQTNVAGSYYAAPPASTTIHIHGGNVGVIGNNAHIEDGMHMGTPALTAKVPELPPNPFTDVVAVRDAQRFVGRHATLRRLCQQLAQGSVALIGERKMGKSSLLGRLAEQLRTELGQTVIRWDFFDLGDAGALLEHVTHALGESGASWTAFKRALHGRRVVLLLDELELAPRRGFDVDLLRGCRALVHQERGLRFITASRVLPKVIFPTQDGSWPYDFLSPQSLGAFSEADARALLAHAWAPQAPHFSESDVNQLIALSACHPYRLQRAAHHRYAALADPDYDWRAAYALDMEALL